MSATRPEYVQQQGQQLNGHPQQAFVQEVASQTRLRLPVRAPACAQRAGKRTQTGVPHRQAVSWEEVREGFPALWAHLQVCEACAAAVAEIMQLTYEKGRGNYGLIN